MRFKVPQFIDIEDKIFGPFTFRQFVYLAGGAGLSFVLYKVLPLFLAAPFILIVVGFSLALTFYRLNNKPFIFVLQSFLKYSLRGKLYIWKRRKEKKKPALQPKVGHSGQEKTYVPQLSASKLKDLSWNLDVLDLNKKEE